MVNLWTCEAGRDQAGSGAGSGGSRCFYGHDLGDWSCRW